MPPGGIPWSSRLQISRNTDLDPVHDEAGNLLSMRTTLPSFSSAPSSLATPGCQLAAPLHDGTLCGGLNQCGRWPAPDGDLCRGLRDGKVEECCRMVSSARDLRSPNTSASPQILKHRSVNLRHAPSASLSHTRMRESREPRRFPGDPRPQILMFRP